MMYLKPSFLFVARSCLVILTMLFTTFACCQQPLKVIHKKKIYLQQAAADSSYKMVSLKSIIPNIVYDLRYATAQNFTGQQLYKSGTHTFLRLPAARALQGVQQALLPQGYALKVFDAYRPYAATVLMWELVKDERYVANPAKGSGHNRGLAIDVTLIDLATGKELDMGTGFDNFTDTAHHTFTQLSPTVLQHRALLKTTMEHFGFRALQTEWWHYSWPNDKAFDVLNLDFKKLK